MNVILASCVLVIAAGPHVSYAQAPPRQLATATEGWVPFDADYTSPSMNGRYFRASDGSMRQEGAAQDGTKRFISIVSIARKEAYFYSSDRNTWTVRPVIVPAEGYKPLLGDPLLTRGHRQLHNIERRPQSSELFVPPANVTLTEIAKP